MKLSVVILTKNEEENIKDCIKTVLFADELIIIDDNSTDNTRKIAKKLGAKIYRRDLDGNFAKQRNFGLKKTIFPWVLFIDPDERVSKSLATEIKSKIQNPRNLIGFLIKRVDVIFGKQLKFGETGSINLIRLAKKDAGKWKRKVHETWQITGEVGSLKPVLQHYPHPTISSLISSLNFFTTIHARENNEEGKKSSLLKIIFWPLGKFISNWVFKLGLLDGMQGLLVALMMSLHSYLAWGKLWLYQKKR